MSTSLASANQTKPELPRVVRVFLHNVELKLFVGDMPTLLSQPNSPVYWSLEDLVKIADNVWFLPASISYGTIQQAAGHNPRKIDYAVPQTWYDMPEIKARRDSGDRAFWSYEGIDHIFGKPLWLSEVYENLRKEIRTVLPGGMN